MITLAPILIALGISGADLNFNPVKKIVFDREKQTVPDIWVLDFTFRKPRYIVANIPGKGRRHIWYMTYKVINKTGAPRRFIPKFTLVTSKGDTFADVVLPRAEKAVQAREDPTGRYKLYNSVTMATQEIPPTPDEGAPIEYRGVAFWEGVDKTRTNAFSVFVTGLSNGYVKTEVDGKEVMKRKTLKLDFTKKGDLIDPDEKEISYAGHEYIYR